MSIIVSQRVQVHQHFAQALTGKDYHYPCLIRSRRYCCYPQVEIRRDVPGHQVSELNELPEFVCLSLFISFNELLNVHCMSTMALPWSPQRCTSSDSGCDRHRRSDESESESESEIFIVFLNHTGWSSVTTNNKVYINTTSKTHAYITFTIQIAELLHCSWLIENTGRSTCIPDLIVTQNDIYICSTIPPALFMTNRNTERCICIPGNYDTEWYTYLFPKTFCIVPD